jgi:hypothetical protein
MKGYNAMFQGLTQELQTPKNLLAKLQFDFARIKANPLDAYAAFDFFVTAEHIPDWVGDKSIKISEPFLRVVSHIANGAKHFRATDPKHKSVKNVDVRKGAFQSGVFQSDAFDVGDLVVELKGDEVKMFGAEISVRRLAQMVIEYWVARIT